MSVCMADDLPSTVTPQLWTNERHETTYRKALNNIRSRMKDASGSAVHIYSFNVPLEQLESAYALLDKEEQRKTMRVTYSDDHNFIVRYMPGRAHQEAIGHWNWAMAIALMDLIPLPHPSTPPACVGIGATAFQLGPGKKQADAGIRPMNSDNPSIVLEVGSSESLGQLRIDAKLWIEHMPQVWLVIVLSIDHPTATHPNLPVIVIELWRGIPPARSLRSHNRKAQMVWQANWTHNATPLYILLSDIFRGQVPPAYGANDCVHLDTVAWRQAIINSWQ